MDIPVQPRQQGVKNVPDNGRLMGTGLGKRLRGNNDESRTIVFLATVFAYNKC
jgi:hypothetical protein